MNTTAQPTHAELATALLTADNILRDIRLSHQEGILPDRADYHMSHIDRSVAGNHLLLCARCRRDAQAQALRARMADTIAPIPAPEPPVTTVIGYDLARDAATPAPPDYGPAYIELTGTQETLRIIIYLGVSPEGRALPPMAGCKIARFDGDITRLMVTLHGARHLWRACTARLSEIIRTILFGQPGEATRSHFEEFRRLMRARRLLDAAVGASLPKADQHRMDSLFSDIPAQS